MKKRLYFISTIMIIFMLSGSLFSQENVKIEIKNPKIKFKAFNSESVRDNAFKVSIIDNNDEQITGLVKGDFRVIKGKKEAEITELTPLSKIGDTKIRLALLIDNSASMSAYVKDVLRILDEMVNYLGRGFYLSVIMFDETIDNTGDTKDKMYVRRLPYTREIKRIKDYYNYGLKNLTARTFLHDAIKVTLGTFAEDTMQKVEKNIAVILSDGNDIGSKTSPKQVEDLNKKGITFYTIDFMHSSRESGGKNDILEKIAKDSKGEYFSPKDISTLSSNFRKIATKIVNLGYEVEYRFKYPKPALTYKLDENEFANRPEKYRSFKGLLMEDVIIRESFPLLNYFFFDKNSDSLSNRYNLFTSADQTSGFTEEKIEGGAIEHYYHLLNIYGERLKNHPDANIKLIGATDGSEPKWKDLATKRAMKIKEYFTDIWQIDSARITIQPLKLPAKASSSRLEEGKSENRRVEIITENWGTSKPVTFIQNEFNVTPKYISFSASGGDSVTLDELSLNVTGNNSEWNRFSYNNTNKTDIKYDWKNNSKLLPHGLTELNFKLKAVDNGGDEATSESISIPVKEITSEVSKTENLQEKKIEKVSLILFDFDSYDPGVKNEVIMKEYVYPKLSDTTQYILVNGYTDIIGKPEYNLKLSSKRAETVSLSLTNQYTPEKVKFTGFGAEKPLYTNELPEGRFYNRTVQLIFQNFQPEE